VLEATESHQRKKLGLKDQADAIRREARQSFSNLALFPFLEVKWQAGEEDREPTAAPGRLRALKPGLVDACPAAVRVLRQKPEAVAPANWDPVERLCADQRQSGLLPGHAAWFAPVVPTGTAFQAYARLAYARLTTPSLSSEYDVPKLGALLQYAPFDPGLIYLYVGRKFGAKPPPKELTGLLGPLLDYNLWAMKRRAALFEDDVAAYRGAYEPICRLDPDSCLTLASYLVDRDVEEGTAEAFERAVSGAHDRVGVANRSGWLLDYYFDHRRPDDALRLAQMAADVYSAEGLRLMGRLMERMGRYREAESYYKKIVERYQNQEVIDAFYIRYEQRIGDGRFRAEAQEALKKRFPQGLQRATLADLGPAPLPGRGYTVTWKPDLAMERLGLKPRDVIVALDGYRVDTHQQYEVVWRFTDKRDVAMIVWREGHYVELKGQMRREPYGPSAASSDAVADWSPRWP
jgi:hypothetical protein